jgi:diguanylate cyclase (GGDEF)-like protein
MIFIGICTAVFFGIGESALHSFIFREGKFRDWLFNTDPHELLLRSIVISLIILLSIIARVLIKRNRQVDNLKKCREDLENTAAERTAELKKVREELLHEIADSEWAESALEQANTKLKEQMKEIERRNSEIIVLYEMGHLLQSCLTAEEVYNVFKQSAQKLFPFESGALYIFSSSRNILESVAIWGEGLLGERVFMPDDCWALRRGQVHIVDDHNSGLHCKHVGKSAQTPYVCAPMTAQSETLGILYLQSSTEEALPESKKRLALTMAEHVALSLSNLKLRDILRNQAIRDPLTGLFNRRYMEESLDRELSRARRHKVSVGVIMLDLDNFKRFNDTFGHEAGDTILRELGIFLKQSIRAEDIACRYGGEEFTIILSGASSADTQNRAEYLRQNVKYLKVRHHGELLGEISLSLGVAAFPDHGATVEAVLRAADAVLYRAKKEGRDRVVVA